MTKEIIKKKVIKKVILIGAGASGKDHAKTLLARFGFSAEVSCTTRMPRKGEVAGETYNFISETQFLKDLFEGNYLQWNYMENGNCYGTLNSEWESKNLFIMTPNSISFINEKYKADGREKDFMVIWLDIPENIRATRLNKRITFDIEHRLKMDNNMFSDCVSDVVISNPEFTDTQLLDVIFSNVDYDSVELLKSIKGVS